MTWFRMKVRLKFEREDVYWMIAIFVFTAVLSVTTPISIWILGGFFLAYVAMKWLEIEWSGSMAWLWTALGIFLSSIFSTYMVQYLLLTAELRANTTDYKLRLNILCCMVLYVGIQILTNHLQLTCIISHSILMLLAGINYFVYMFRGNEFIFSDIRSVSTGLSVAGNYEFTLDERAIYVILLSTLYISFIRKCKITFVKHKIGMRVTCVVLAIVGSVFLANETASIVTETWEQKGSYRNGYVLNFLLSMRDYFVQAPEGYSVEAVAALEECYTVTEEMITSKPTIIAIMSESYADLTTIGAYNTNIEVNPYFQSIKENTIRGYALSSVFGAKTSNCEWEFMTGNTMAFLPSGSVVYQQYISEEPTSIVSNLKNYGYTCVAMHPYYETGWSRNLVYPDLGFDEMYFINHFDEKAMLRKYITDQEFYEKIIARYESKGKNEDLFIMGISMQNHGGYTEKYDNFQEEVRILTENFTDANQYLSLVHESDQALKYLIEYFSAVEEPVEIIFFGDHQPSLRTDFYKRLNGKGLSGLNLEELQNLYKVPFFIWTNYESEEVEIPITSLNYLSTLALERAGLPLPAYNQFLKEMMEYVPAINARGYYSAEQKKYQYLSDAKDEEAEWISKYEILQYNSMFERNNQSKVFFPYMK